MGRKLKQIKRDDLGESGKKVIDSLIGADKIKGTQKEESHEPMRCKIEILQGSVKKALVDSYTVNTTSLHKTIDDIIIKHGENVQFKITNLNDEKIVAKRMLYTGGYNKEKDDKEHFARQMDTIRKINKMKEEGKTFDEIRPKFAHLAGESYIRKIYNSTEEEMIQILKDVYSNQSLGKSTISEILSEDLNAKKDIVNNIDNKKGVEEYEE